MVKISYDSVNFFRFCHRRYDSIEDPVNQERLFADLNYRLSNRFDIHLDVAKCMQYMSTHGSTYGSAYMAIQTTLFQSPGTSILGDKETMAWTKIPSFLEMCPSGKALIILRDPRDVINSFRLRSIAPGSDYLISLFDCVDCINHALRFTHLYPDRVYMVQFEKLKHNPSLELQAICEFLGIDYLPHMLDGSSYKDHQGKPWDAAAHLTDPTNTNPLSVIGRWQHQLPEEDLFLTEWIAERQLRQLGYGPSGRTFSQNTFDHALSKVTSSSLLRSSFKKWVQTGEGVELFPLDPTIPANWDPNWNKNPSSFTSNS